MKYTIVGIVAVLAIIAAIVSPVMAGGYRDYAAEELSRVKAYQENVYTLKGDLRCHTNLFDQYLLIQRVGEDGVPMGDPGRVEIDQAGHFETILAKGKYYVTLPPFKGLGYVETAYVVCEGFPAGVVSLDHPFEGHAASAATPDQPRQVVIKEATYGKIVYSQEIDTPAYDEQVYHAGQARHANLVYQGHGQFDYEAGHVHARQLNNAQVDFVHDCRNYHITGDKHDDAFVVTQAGYTETIHHPATYKTVATGAVVDVKAQVQAAVDAQHFAIKFDNAKNPGGLFDAGTNELLAQIADPAPGIVKSVHIVADGITHDANEYEAINL